jgi:aminocarboxymuconate-semialdehyde decarboxylase
VLIDTHTHVIPRAALDRARAGDLFGIRVEHDTVIHPEGFRYPVTADFEHAAAIIGRMDNNGIGESILSLAPTMFLYDQPADVAVDFAREVNDALAELVDGSARLRAFAHLPMQAPAEAAVELRRSAGAMNLAGAFIGTTAQEVPLDDPAMDPVWQQAEELDVPVFLHPYYTGVKPGLADFYMTNVVGNPLDTCVAAIRLIASGTLDRFPRLRIALVHGGGFLPYQLGRLDRAFDVRAELQGLIPQAPSSYLSRFWIDNLLHGDAQLLSLADLIGPDRLVLGTDLPFDMGEPDPVSRLRRVGIDLDALTRATRMLFADVA